DGLRGVGERVFAVEGQREIASFDRVPQVGLHRPDDLFDFLDGAGAEADADIPDAPHGVEVEIELAREAAEAPDIDDATPDGRRGEILVRHVTGNLIDDQVYALTAGGVE